MSRASYTPRERIIDRVVHLWIGALRAPKYDNGDRTGGSALAAGLTARMPKNNDEETLARFGDELKARLMKPFTFKPYIDAQRTAWVTELRVDYDPCQPLADAASAAGLKMAFPWKTSMYFDENYVQFIEGYGAEGVNHYPAAYDEWVVTTLRGSEKDIAALVAFVETGARADFFKVEH